MSGECEECNEHCLDCKCEPYNKEQKAALLKAINERFSFTKEGEMIAKHINSYEPIVLSDYMMPNIGCDEPGTYVDVSGINHPILPIPEYVNHPNHYQGKTFEVIDIIEDYELNFNLGNAIKYILRCDKKDCKKRDLEKAIWYLQREISE